MEKQKCFLHVELIISCTRGEHCPRNIFNLNQCMWFKCDKYPVRTPDLEDEVPLSRILSKFCFIKNIILVTKIIYEFPTQLDSPLGRLH